MSDLKHYGEIQPPDTIVCVEWMDSSSQSGPIGRADLSGVHRLMTCGWLIRENDDHVTVCMDYVPGQDEFRDVQHILKVNVVKRTEWKYEPQT